MSTKFTVQNKLKKNNRMVSFSMLESKYFTGLRISKDFEEKKIIIDLFALHTNAAEWIGLHGGFSHPGSRLVPQRLWSHAILTLSGSDLDVQQP